MEQDQDVLESLMTGLPERDRSGLRDAIRDAQRDQLDAKQHPPRRRRRNADGVLVDPPPGTEHEYDVDGSDDQYDEADGERTEARS